MCRQVAKTRTYLFVFGDGFLRRDIFGRLCFLEGRLEPPDEDLARFLGRRTAVAGHPLVGCVGVEAVFDVVGGPAGQDTPLDLAPAGAKEPLYKPPYCTRGMGG